jgi:hypothetical protein
MMSAIENWTKSKIQTQINLSGKVVAVENSILKKSASR